MTTGACLCGGIRFTVAGDLPPLQICHCSQCRRAQGSAFAANLPIRSEAFQLHSGEDLKFKCPYQAKVMNTLDANSRTTGKIWGQDKTGMESLC